MRIKRWIYTPVLIIFGIAAIVAGILGIHKINKAKRQLKKLVNSVKSDSLLYNPTTKSFVNKGSKSNNKKVYYIFILFGAACLILGCFSCINIMADKSIIDIRDTLFENVISWLAMFIGGVISIAFGVSGKKPITNNSSEWDNMQVTGTVIKEVFTAEHTLPGYGRLLIEYKDPYDGKTKYYALMQHLRLKKHPIGSKYMLSYSRSQRTAYDIKSNKLTVKRNFVLIIIAILLFALDSVSIAMYFGGLR